MLLALLWAAAPIHTYGWSAGLLLLTDIVLAAMCLLQTGALIPLTVAVVLALIAWHLSDLAVAAEGAVAPQLARMIGRDTLAIAGLGLLALVMGLAWTRLRLELSLSAALIAGVVLFVSLSGLVRRMGNPQPLQSGSSAQDPLNPEPDGT